MFEFVDADMLIIRNLNRSETVSSKPGFVNLMLSPLHSL